MANKFSDSLRESIVAEKNKVEASSATANNKVTSKPAVSDIVSSVAATADKSTLKVKSVINKPSMKNNVSAKNKSLSKIILKPIAAATAAKNTNKTISTNKVKNKKISNVKSTNNKSSVKLENGIKKTIMEMHEELRQAYKNAMSNVNNDLLHYMSCLPIDGNLAELTKANLSYLHLLHKRHREVVECSSSFYRELFSVLAP